MNTSSLFQPIVAQPRAASAGQPRATSAAIEFGEYDPPPLGSLANSGANTAATPSRAPSRREVQSPGAEYPATPVNWNTPYLQLGQLGGEARRQIREDYRAVFLEQENRRRVQESIEMARNVLQQQNLEQALRLSLIHI